MVLKKESGFTLIELMVVIVILGILSGIVIPNMMGWRSAAKLRSAVNQIRGDLQSARFLAIKRNTTIRIQFKADSYVIEAEDGSVLKTRQLPAGVSIDLASTTLTDYEGDGKIDTSFDGRGIPAPGVTGDLGNLVIKGQAGSRQININAVGRIQTS